MTDEPGRAAWQCPGCGFVVGWVNEEHELVIWGYPRGFIILRSGTFACACGAVIQWYRTMPPQRLDTAGTPMVQ